MILRCSSSHRLCQPVSTCSISKPLHQCHSQHSRSTTRCRILSRPCLVSRRVASFATSSPIPHCNSHICSHNPSKRSLTCKSSSSSINSSNGNQLSSSNLAVASRSKHLSNKLLSTTSHRSLVALHLHSTWLRTLHVTLLQSRHSPTRVPAAGIVLTMQCQLIMPARRAGRIRHATLRSNMPPTHPRSASSRSRR